MHIWVIVNKTVNFSAAWKAAVIVPIFKASEPTDVANYRPISILPVASKIAEKVVIEQLTDFLNSGQALLHPMQFGFRKNYSTEMATCYFTYFTGSAVGAFDTVNHNVLLSQLSNFLFF